MIGTIEIKVTAARPNMPLSPMFAFKGSPSSLRILEVPKKIGDWNITNINVVAHYPDNTTIETAATRTGNVWVATFEGCNISGKVDNGLEITADGIDEAGQNVQGYVLGAGDIFILERDADIEDAVSKITMRYCETIPEQPTIGDFIVLEGVAKFYDGTKWISIDTDLSEYATKDELAAAVSNKAEISSVEAVADDVEDLSNSLSNYYTKSETSSNVEITTALNGKLDLSSTVDKALISQKLVNNLSDEHSTRVVVDEYDNVLIQKYVQSGWYVSRIETALSVGSEDYTDTDAYYAYVFNCRISADLGIMYFSLFIQDKQRKGYPFYNYSGYTTDYALNEFQHNIALQPVYNGTDHNIFFRLTIKNAENPFWTTVARLVPDSSDYCGLMDKQIRPTGTFLTPSMIEPFSSGGFKSYARNSYGTIAVYSRMPTGIAPNYNTFALFNPENGKLCRATQTYLPWLLSMYDDTTFDPPLEMTYAYRSTVTIKVNGRIQQITINDNCWLATHAASSKTTNAYYILAVEDENGDMTPDTNFHVGRTSSYPITFSENKLSVATIDTVNGITCTRQSASKYTAELNYYAYEEDISASLSAKADLSAIPTKTSQLSNDSGFITSADVPTQSYIADANENRINADRSISFIGDGTPYWVITSTGGSTWLPMTYQLSGTKTNSSYYPAGVIYDGSWQIALAYDDMETYWWLETRSWDAGLQEWSEPTYYYDYQSGEDATELSFGGYISSCVWTTPRVVINDNLVTESSLSSIIARLEARIAALENQ